MNPKKHLQSHEQATTHSDTNTTHSNKKQKSSSNDRKTAIYVTGLPTDISLPELTTYFSKVGIIFTDYLTGQPKVKLYKDTEGNVKGDALIIYFREESVQLAIDLLDESEIRDGVKVRVSRADFEGGGGTSTVEPKEEKGKEKEKDKPDEHSNTLKKKPPTSYDKKLMKKHLEEMNKKLEWGNEYADEMAAKKKAEKYKRILLLKHMFNIDELDNDPSVIFDIKADIMEECERFGVVQNVQLYDAMEEGYVTVKFEDPFSVDRAIKVLDGRFFDGKRIEATRFDGSITLKKSQDTLEESERRLERFGDWLEGKLDEDERNNEEEKEEE